MSEPRLNLVMPERAQVDLEFSVATDEADFPHDVLKVALTKYLEKFIGENTDEEALAEMKKDITKFLNRMVKTSAVVSLDEVNGNRISVSFELIHELK